MNTFFRLALKVFGFAGIATAAWWLTSSTNVPQAQQAAPLSPQSQMITLTDFDAPTEADRWRNVADTVMGGVSQSAFSIAEDGYGVFSGTLSLENNGGFTSVRYAIDESSLSGTEAIALRVKGDGRTYQFRLRMSESARDISYRSEFETSGEWQMLRLPIESFEPVFRGRVVENAPTLEMSKIQQIGFLLASKDSGDFRLEIDSIQAEL